jgi:hypothetical protein
MNYKDILAHKEQMVKDTMAKAERENSGRGGKVENRMKKDMTQSNSKRYSK